MADIMHGRRKGTSREMDKEQGPFEVPAGMQLANGTDLRQVTILGRGDWERIQNQLNRRQIEEARIQRLKAEREQMKIKSKDLVKNWGNTIAGSRHRKLEARKLREEKEELEKCQVDIEEAKFQAEKRKEAIEKARTQQYYQTDRVKGFHGALLLTEVLKEREAQIELKKLKKVASAGREREWLDKARYQYEASIKEDQSQAADRIRRAADNSSFQATQIREHLKETQGRACDERTEGDQLKKLAVQYNIEKERLEKMRRDERKLMMEDNRQQIQDVKRMKEIHVQQQEEEDEECRLFAEAKRKMMTLRSAKESLLHKDKQATLDRIREKLGAQIKQKVDDEDDRIDRATEEIEAKKQWEDQMKDAKTRRLMEDAATHRNKQMKKLEEQKKQQKMEEYQMVKVRQEADAVFQINEEEKMRRRRDEAQELRNFHEQQSDERRQKSEEEIDRQLALDQKNVALLAVEEDQFQEYANAVIDHCAKGGRNTYPLTKAAKEGAGGGNGPVFLGKGGLRPSYMVCDNTGKQLPCFHGESTEETKQAIYGKAKTKQRLGFVW